MQAWQTNQDAHSYHLCMHSYKKLVCAYIVMILTKKRKRNKLHMWQVIRKLITKILTILIIRRLNAMQKDSECHENTKNWDYVNHEDLMKTNNISPYVRVSTRTNFADAVLLGV